MICPKCNQPVADGVRFCINCGADVGAAPAAAEAPAEKPAEKPANAFVEEALNTVKKVPRKYFAFGGIGVAAIALIIVIATIISGLGSAANYLLYAKEDEIMMGKLSGGESWQLTEELCDGFDLNEGDVPGFFGSDDAIQLSKDGKKIFYFDKVELGDTGLNLYYKATSGAKAKATKLASDVRRYDINTAGTKVIYLDTDGNLYSHNLKEKTKITKDVSYFYASDDCNKLYWVTTEGDLYYKDGNKDKEKIASEISDLAFINENFTAAYYIKDDSLYVKQAGKDKAKIASDVRNVIRIYENGCAYYTVYEEPEDESGDESAKESKSWYDFVTDDCLEDDEAILEEYDYDSDEYQEALNRNYLRDRLKGMTYYGTGLFPQELIYYDGKKPVSITAEFVDYKTCKYDTPVIVYGTQAKEEIGSIKLSTLAKNLEEAQAKNEEDFDADDFVEAQIFGDPDSSNETMYVAVKEKATQFDQENAFSFRMNEKGNLVYFLDEKDDEKSIATLYKMNISDGKAKAPEKYDDDVYTSSISFIDNDSIRYFKDVDEEKYEGELFVDKKSVDGDVYVYGLNTTYNGDKKTGKFYYLAEYDSEDGYGTLKYYNGSKAVVVHEEVSDYTVSHKGDALFLYDVSEKHHTGELYIFSGSKAKKIDEDVMGVLPYVYVDGEGNKYF